jgi:hypothetical protein
MKQYKTFIALMKKYEVKNYEYSDSDIDEFKNKNGFETDDEKNKGGVGILGMFNK